MNNGNLYPKPLNELARQRALDDLKILDSAPESAFDELVKIAAQICDCPYAMVTFIDRERQWFKARYQVPFQEAPRYGGFCTQAIMEKTFFTVPDASLDPRFSNHPIVVGPLHIRFYAAAPIVIDGEFNIGVICVSDIKPRELSLSQIENLKSFSRLLSVLLEGRRSLIEKEWLQQARLSFEKEHIHLTQMATLAQQSGVVAHEIKSPLMVMKLALESIKQLVTVRPGCENKVQSHFEKLERSYMRIDKISKSFSTYSRDSREDQPVLNSIGSLIEDTMTFCSARLQEKQIKLIVEGVDLDLKIECRAVEISQVFLNLINNSIDAIEGESEKWVRLSVRNQGDEVQLSFTDSGKGITPEICTHIFKPFFTTKGVSKGTGLGLSVCRGIIERHGGKIEFNPTSENTQFNIHLPKAQKVED